MTYSQGRHYIGQWLDRIFHGFVTYTTEHGDQFAGYFKNGLKYRGALLARLQEKLSALVVGEHNLNGVPAAGHASARLF